MLSVRAKGFSLIEVLISILILTLGAVGAIGLQLASIRTSQQSAFHAIAVNLANELAEKMRANDTQMKLPDGLNVFSSIKYNALTDGNPSSSVLCYSSLANCNPTELAKADIYEWLTRIKNSLPGAHVVVCRDLAPYDESKKKLTWTCSSDGSASFVIKIGWSAKNLDGTLIEKDGIAPPNLAIAVESYIK